MLRVYHSLCLAALLTACGGGSDTGGYRNVDWSAVINGNPGQYRATLTANDFYGNTDSWSTVWTVNGN